MKQKLRVFCTLLLLAVASVGWADTGTITFGNNGVKINATVVYANDNLGNKWDIGTQGTTSFTQNTSYSQVGSSSKPASKITFTTTLPQEETISSFSVNLGGFSGTAGTVNLTVDGETVGTGNLNGTSDVTVESTSEIKGKVLKVTVTDIAKGVKCYNVSYTYTSSGTSTVATPTFSPAAGVYTSAQDVTINTTTEGATIHYTTDGTDPTDGSTEYTAPITVATNTTIKAIAVKQGMDNSAIATATYKIVNLVHAGTEADPYSVADAITLLSADPSATYDNVYVSGIISQIDSYDSQHKSITYWISDDGSTDNQFEVYSGKGLNGAEFEAKEDLTVGNSVVVKGTIKKYNSTYEFNYNSVIVSMTEVSHPVINVDEALSLEYDATSGEIAYTVNNAVEGKSLSAATTAGWISNISVGASAVTFTVTANEGTEDRSATITLSYEGAENKIVTVTQKHFVADYATLPFEFNNGKGAIAATAGLTESGLGSDYTSAPKLKFDNAGDVLVLKFNERPGKLTFDIKGNSFSGGTFKVQTSEDGEAYTDLATYTELGATQSEKFDVLGENVRYIKWVYTEKSSGNVALGNITLAEYSETPVETPKVNVGTLTNVTIAKMWIGDDNLTDIEDGAEVEAGTEVFVEFTVAEGYTFESFNVVDADGNAVTVTENTGNWSFVMPESNVTITATATENTPAGDKTLTNANIVAAGNGDTSYKEWTITDTNGKDWKAYAIKNQHSNATSAYHYLQIKKYASSTAYYLQVPEYGTKITKIEMTVSGSSKPMADGGNTATLFFSSNNSTSATGDGVALGTGASTVTIDCSSLNLNTGFITASGAVRIWDVTVTYEEAEEEVFTIDENSTDNNVMVTNGNVQILRTFGAGYWNTFMMPYNGVTKEQLMSIFGDDVKIKAVKINNEEGYILTGVDGNTISFSDYTDNDFSNSLNYLYLIKPSKDVVNPVFKNVTTTAFAETMTYSSNDGNLKIVGSPKKINMTADEGFTAYYLSTAGSLKKASATATLKGTRFYFQTKNGVEAKVFIDGEATSIEAIDNGEQASGKQEIFNLAGQRVQKAQKGIYIVNGKKVVVK